MQEWRLVVFVWLVALILYSCYMYVISLPFISNDMYRILVDRLPVFLLRDCLSYYYLSLINSFVTTRLWIVLISWLFQFLCLLSRIWVFRLLIGYFHLFILKIGLFPCLYIFAFSFSHVSQNLVLMTSSVQALNIAEIWKLEKCLTIRY